MSSLFIALRRLLGLAALVATPLAAEAAEPPPLEAYGALPAFEFADLSPSGKVAIIGLLNGQRMLLILDQELKPINAMQVGDLKVRNLDWAGDDAILVESSHTARLDERFLIDKLEVFNVMIVPLDNTKPAQTVFANQRKMVKAVFGQYGLRQVDGRWVGYFGGREMAEESGNHYYDGAGESLFQVDLASNRPRKVEGALSDVQRNWLVDGRGAVAANFEWNHTTGAWRITNRAGDRLAAGTEPKGAVGLIAFGHDGNSVIYGLEDEQGDSRWYEVPLDGSAQPVELLADVNVYSFYTDPYSDRLVGYRPDNPEADVVFLDPALEAAAAKIRKAFGANGRMVEWTPDVGHVLVRTRGNGDSGTWYFVDMQSLRATMIGAERPKIGANVGPISTVSYTAADGTELDGILTLPPGREAAGLPLVMLPHGGPHSHDIATFDWWAQAFASRGYAVFQPNFRGSTNRDGAFERAGYGQWGRKMQTDLSDGIAELARQGIVDPARACIVGASYGGYAALAGVTVQNGLYRCAVAVAGVSDLGMMYESDLHERGNDRLVKKNLREELGDPGSLAEVSPRRLANRADAPILLIHGRDDTVVEFAQSKVMADALREAGKPHRLVELESEDHWLSRPATRLQMLEEAVAFVQQHNPAD